MMFLLKYIVAILLEMAVLLQRSRHRCTPLSSDHTPAAAAVI